MTEAEADILLSVSNDYFHDLSKLVAKHLSKLPEDLQDLGLMRMCEVSVYSTAYEKYMEEVNENNPSKPI